jgi:spoIIIJ-associated protein
MSPSFEFEDKSVEKAVQKACEELNIPKKDLKHDVISYGSTGIFGLVGTKKARIRVNVPEPEPAPEADSQSTAADVISLTEPIVEDAAVPQTADADEIDAQNEDDDPKTVGREALQRIVDFITTDATIAVTEKSDRIMFDINGGNAAVLIGRRGQTLEAIQYLVEKIINKRRGKRVRIQVDVEGYAKNRRAGLKKLAGRTAEKVKRTGKPATIGQMNAHDRRIVHMALKDDNAVRTQSIGEGYIRKLVIFPKKNFYRKRKPDR